MQRDNKGRFKKKEFTFTGVNLDNLLEVYDESIHKKAAIATIKKIIKIMHGPAYRTAYDLMKYQLYLMKEYGITDKDLK